MRERRLGAGRGGSPRGWRSAPPDAGGASGSSAATGGRIDVEAFERFVSDSEPRLRRALVAAYGPEAGRDATVDALAWAWTNWAKVQQLHNPVGYLYRVGQTKAREQRQAGLTPVAVDDGTVQTLGGPGAASARPEPWYEPGLDPALHDLTEQQRVAVVLCHGFQWTHREVAELLELSTSSVQNHVERGLAKLRRALEVNPDA